MVDHETHVTRAQFTKIPGSHICLDHIFVGSTRQILLVTPCLLTRIREFIHTQHRASQYHTRPNAKRGIAMLSVDKFPYPRKQTRCNEFIPCSNDVCQIMKRFRSFKISDTPFIWFKSSYKYSVARSHRSGKESGRRSWSPLWPHQWRSSFSLDFTPMTSNVRYVSILHGC